MANKCLQDVQTNKSKKKKKINKINKRIYLYTEQCDLFFFISSFVRQSVTSIKISVFYLYILLNIKVLMSGTSA